MRYIVCAVMVVGLLMSGVLLGLAAEETATAAVQVKQKSKKKNAVKTLKSREIISIDGESRFIIVADKDGKELEVEITDKTKYKKAKEFIALSDLKAGQKVTIFLKKKPGAPEASTVMVLKPEVKSPKAKKGAKKEKMLKEEKPE
ncbi:MAG: hypothetical protein JW803_01190 [Endomicrobiales bacterium]|nr:hypothetical protein [Endomicrobiales bacterium]